MCLIRYVACLADGSSTLEELCEHVLLPAEHSKDSWASLKQLIPRSRLCTNTWSAGRMPEPVLSPGALLLSSPGLKLARLLLITSTGKGCDCSLSASELSRALPPRKVRSQISSAEALLDESCCCCEGHVPLSLTRAQAWCSGPVVVL